MRLINRHRRLLAAQLLPPCDEQLRVLNKPGESVASQPRLDIGVIGGPVAVLGGASLRGGDLIPPPLFPVFIDRYACRRSTYCSSFASCSPHLLLVGGCFSLTPKSAE